MDESSGPVVCRWNGCNNKYDSPEELSKHLDFQHDLSDWVCHWTPCSRNLKPFDARYKLIVHLRCHTGEKPYKCTMAGCSRRFSRIENMRLHVRTHTGEKPYACGYEGCPKRFNNSSDRAKHVKTHIQTKPYKCKFPGCDKHYTDPSSMRKHFRSIHYRSEQAGKQNNTNLRMHNYSPALPAKQPRLAPTPVVSTSIVTPANSVGMNDATTNSQATSAVMINSNSNNNGNNSFVQVPVFQLPARDEPQSDVSQLIQEGKIQPILLKNGDQQSMLMFVPTANMHGATGAGVTMIPLLPQTSQQQDKPTLHSTSTHTTTTSNKITDPTERPVRPAKNVHVIVSSGKSKEQQIDHSESSTSC